MPIIARETHKLFGSAGATTYFAEFGSLVAAAPLKTKDIASIQALPAWDDGWQESIFGANKDLLLQDLNGWCYEHSYQVAYIFQWGIPEYDAATEYETGSVVQGKKGAANAGQWFASLQDGNTGNTPPTSADNAFWRWANRPIPTSFGFGNALKANLLVKPNAGAPLTKVDITADLVSVQGVSLSGVAATADITISGAPNGLDSGAAAANTKYAVHVITNDAGTLVASLLSLSATAPALPAGYTKFRRVRWIRTTGASQIVQQAQVGDWVYYTDALTFTVSNPNGTTSFGAAIPSTSRLGAFAVSLSTASGNLTVAISGTAQPPYQPAVIDVTNGQARAVCELPLDAGQQMDCVSSVCTIRTLGYYDPV